MLTVPALRRAAAGLRPDARQIHLQLASLEFADVAATRFLATLTERPGRPEVILYYPPPSLTRLIRLLFPAGLAGLSVCRGRERSRPADRPGNPQGGRCLPPFPARQPLSSCGVGRSARQARRAGHGTRCGRAGNAAAFRCPHRGAPG